MADIDPDLQKGLKAAKSKKMFFAFIPKGGSDGKLIVQKTKIKPADIAAARKEIGGGVPVTGKCIGPVGDMVFTTAKPAPGTLANCLKVVARRDAALAVVATFVLSADADAEEPEGESESEEAGASAEAPPTAPPPPPVADSSIAGIQKALTKLGYAPGAADGAMGPKTKAAIMKFQQDKGLAADGTVGPKTQAALAQALKGAGAGGAAASGAVVGADAANAVVSPRDAASGQADGAAADTTIPPPPPTPPRFDVDLPHWTAARKAAIDALKGLAAKVAATKHGDAAGVVKEIASLCSRLPANPQPNQIDALKQMIASDEAITAAEQSPKHFHDLVIRKPLLDSLDMLRS